MNTLVNRVEVKLNNGIRAYSNKKESIFANLTAAEYSSRTSYMERKRNNSTAK